MKIGIAITTTPKRKEVYDLCRKQIRKHTPKDIEVITVEDTTGRGVAYGKNVCLENLKTCDYIFLFDDDCFPIKDDWEKVFIRIGEETGNHHFLYLKETPSLVKIGERGMVERFNNCGGCMIYITKEVIEKVGGFCKDYGRYGYEHAGYSHRIHQAGLTPYGEYLAIKGAGDYIYSLDYDHHIDFGVKPSMNIDPREINNCIAENKKIYDKDIETIYQPL